jgi:hypothetical protein
MNIVHIPFVLLADIIFLAEIDEIDDWLGCEQLQSIDNIDLEKNSSINVIQSK